MSTDATPATPAPTPATPAPQPNPAAIWLPIGKITGTPGERITQVQTKYSPILGGGRVYSRNQGSYNFLTTNLEDSILHPKNHGLEGQSRYEWRPGPDDPEILYGYLVPVK